MNSAAPVGRNRRADAATGGRATVAATTPVVISSHPSLGDNGQLAADAALSPTPPASAGLFAPLPAGEFDMIVVDPPWRFANWSKTAPANRAADGHYATMTLDDIATLPVKDIAARDSHLALWITGPMLTVGAHLPLMAAWGFKPSSIAWIWLKANRSAMQGKMLVQEPLSPRAFFMGLGHTTRQNAEYVALGRRGHARRHSKGVHQLIVEPRREHSRKPEAFYEEVRRYAGAQAKCVELFSRMPRDGWTTWGNEANKFGGDDAKA